jgi:hypothetical protein
LSFSFSFLFAEKSVFEVDHQPPQTIASVYGEHPAIPVGRLLCFILCDPLSSD